MIICFRSILLGSGVAIGLLLAACDQSAQPTHEEDESAIATIVGGTMSAMQSYTPTSTPPAPERPNQSTTPTPSPEAILTVTISPTLQPENVTGEICYPGESIPQMVLYFEDTNIAYLLELLVDENQLDYKVKLPPGTYIAYAWLPDFSLGGLYSRAVVCGLGTECEDHSILPFTIEEGDLVEGIDLCDWYAGPFNVPYPPDRELSEVTGTISGSITYPDEPVPELRVVAYNQETQYWYWVSTIAGQVSYTIDELPSGTYHIVAYDTLGHTGGHADNNHVLVPVTIEPGEAIKGVNINDWNAPPGAFPPDQTR
jgi:hypothetical protein